jgi:hypothetical protein
MFLGPPRLLAYAFRNGVALAAGVGGFRVDNFAVEAHVDGEGDGELLVLGEEFASSVVLVPAIVSVVVQAYAAEAYQASTTSRPCRYSNSRQSSPPNSTFSLTMYLKR